MLASTGLVQRSQLVNQLYFLWEKGGGKRVLFMEKESSASELRWGDVAEDNAPPCTSANWGRTAAKNEDANFGSVSQRNDGGDYGCLGEGWFGDGRFVLALFRDF